MFRFQYPSRSSACQEFHLSSARGKWTDLDADGQAIKQSKRKFNVLSMRLTGLGQWCLLRKSLFPFLHASTSLKPPLFLFPLFISANYPSRDSTSWQADECTLKELKIYCDMPPPLPLHHPKDHRHLIPTNLNLNRALIQSRTQTRPRPRLQTLLSNRRTLNRNGIIIRQISLIVWFTICRRDNPMSPPSVTQVLLITPFHRIFTFYLDIMTYTRIIIISLSKHRWVEKGKTTLYQNCFVHNCIVA